MKQMIGRLWRSHLGRAVAVSLVVGGMVAVGATAASAALINIQSCSVTWTNTAGTPSWYTYNGDGVWKMGTFHICAADGGFGSVSVTTYGGSITPGKGVYDFRLLRLNRYWHVVSSTEWVTPTNYIPTRLSGMEPDGEPIAIECRDHNPANRGRASWCTWHGSFG